MVSCFLRFLPVNHKQRQAFGWIEHSKAQIAFYSLNYFWERRKKKQLFSFFWAVNIHHDDMYTKKMSQIHMFLFLKSILIHEKSLHGCFYSVVFFLLSFLSHFFSIAFLLGLILQVFLDDLKSNNFLMIVANTFLLHHNNGVLFTFSICKLHANPRPQKHDWWRKIYTCRPEII